METEREVTPKEAIALIRKAKNVYTFSRINLDDMHVVRVYKQELIAMLKEFEDWALVIVRDIDDDGDIFIGA